MEIPRTIIAVILLLHNTIFANIWSREQESREIQTYNVIYYMGGIISYANMYFEMAQG